MNQDDLFEKEEQLNNSQIDSLDNQNNEVLENFEESNNDIKDCTYKKSDSIKTKEKSLGVNSLFYLIYVVFNMIYPLVTGIYVARILLPADIGQIETARNLVSYFVILSFLGIPTYGLREISKCRNNKDELNKLYTELRIINNISTLFFSLIYISIVLIVPSYRSNIEFFLISGISILLNLLNNSFLYEGLEEFSYISIRNIIVKTISFILLIVFVRTSKDAFPYMFILVFGTAGNYLLNVINARKHVKLTFKNLNIRRHLKSIMFLVVVNLAIEIYALVDVTMLGFMTDNESVAFYSYAMKIYRVLIQILNCFTIVLVPRISLYYKEGRKEEMNKLISKTFIIILLFSLPMVIGIYFTSDFLLSEIYGAAYIRSADVLKILSIILMISPFGYLLGSRMLLITGNESKMIFAVGAGAIVNVLSNLVLIYLYKEIGAAIASLFSEIIVMIIYVCMGRKYFKLNSVLKSIFKIIVSAMLVLLYCYFINKYINNSLKATILQVVGSVLIYFVSLIVLREIICISFIKNLLKKVKK